MWSSLELQGGFDHSEQKLLQYSGRNRNTYYFCQMTAGFFMYKLVEAHLGALSKGHEVTAQADVHFGCICRCAICWVSFVFFYFYSSCSIGIGNSSWRNVKAIGPNPFLLLLLLFSLELLQGWIQHMMNNLFSKVGIRGEGFRGDHASLRLLLKQLKLPQEGQYIVSSGYWT